MTEPTTPVRVWRVLRCLEEIVYFVARFKPDDQGDQ